MRKHFSEVLFENYPKSNIRNVGMFSKTMENCLTELSVFKTTLGNAPMVFVYKENEYIDYIYGQKYSIIPISTHPYDLKYLYKDNKESRFFFTEDGNYNENNIDKDYIFGNLAVDRYVRINPNKLVPGISANNQFDVVYADYSGISINNIVNHIEFIVGGLLSSGKTLVIKYPNLIPLTESSFSDAYEVFYRIMSKSVVKYPEEVIKRYIDNGEVTEYNGVSVVGEYASILIK